MISAYFAKKGPFLQAMILVLLAIFLLDVMAAIVKFFGDKYPAQQMSVLRNLFGLIPSLIVLYASTQWRQAGRSFKMRQWRLGLFRGGLVALAQLCFYTAVVYMEFATATTLAYVGPMIITALSGPVLGEKVGPWRWCAVGLGLMGMLLIMRPGSEVFTLYALLPVGAAFFYASSAIAVRLIDDDVPTPLVNLYGTFGAMVGAIILTLTMSGFVALASVEDTIWMIVMGATGGTAILLMIKAYRLTKPSNLAPFEYFGIVFAFGIGYVVFNEAPFKALFPGALFIVAGGLLIVWRERRAKA